MFVIIEFKLIRRWVMFDMLVIIFFVVILISFVIWVVLVGMFDS